jgi:phosphoribosylformylglycinamidine cyclo-ligase
VAARSAGSTYAGSGVDRSAVSAALAELLAAVRYRPPPTHGRPLDAPGHFAGLVRIGRETLAITTDTVGTKVRLAAEVGRWEEVGEDLVGANVNDLAAVGARPAGLVDTILCDRPDPDAFRGIGRGIDRGLRAAECALLGGETAVVPSIVDGIDLGATALGFFPRGRAPVTGERIRVGDVVVGIPSNGVHANGFTLVRRVLADSSTNVREPRPGSRVPLAEELLRPTRIYSRAADALASRSSTHGFAHLTGGGVRNLVRLRSGVAFVLDRWPEPPPIFAFLQRQGGISDEEMFQTFNMGIGFALVTAPHRFAETRRALARAGAPDAIPIGRVERGEGVSLPARHLEYRGYS